MQKRFNYEITFGSVEEMKDVNAEEAKKTDVPKCAKILAGGKPLAVRMREHYGRNDEVRMMVGKDGKGLTCLMTKVAKRVNSLVDDRTASNVGHTNHVSLIQKTFVKAYIKFWAMTPAATAPEEEKDVYVLVFDGSVLNDIKVTSIIADELCNRVNKVHADKESDREKRQSASSPAASDVSAASVPALPPTLVFEAALSDAEKWPALAADEPEVRSVQRAVRSVQRRKKTRTDAGRTAQTPAQTPEKPKVRFWNTPNGEDSALRPMDVPSCWADDQDDE